MDCVIEARGLTKVYAAGGAQEVRALDGVSFEVRRGEIFGLIGADGAGKTTAFKILSGVIEPSSGDVQILDASPHESRSQVGYLTQPFSLYEDLTVIENLRYAAGLRELPEPEFEQSRRYYLKLFDMDRFEDRLAGRLSGGMKQKLALSCALVFRPKILLLDEPTTGVDPVSRRDFWDALSALSEEGITIVTATPYLDEAERCHRIAFVEDGKILQTGPPARFRSELGLARFEVQPSDLARAETLLAGVDEDGGPIADVQRFGDRLDVLAPSDGPAEDWIRRRLEPQGVRIEHFREASPTLENAFVATLRRKRGRETPPSFPQRSASRNGERGEAGIGAYELDKTFGSFQAVKDFSLEIRYGEVYGLLGANGAGKTTAIKMICGLLAPTRGGVSLLGRREKLRSAEVRSEIGYMSQKFTLYEDLTIAENLDFYASLYGVPERLKEIRKRWALDISGLGGRADMLTRQLPGGWKQRVAFGAALMHEPRVVFLDEPTSGVDPLARRVMWRMINDFADHGAAVLVVTHYLEEAEQCNRLGFMIAGELVAQGSPAEVKRAMSGHLLEIETGAGQKALRVLREHCGAGRVSLFGDRLHVVVDSAEAAAAELRECLAAQGVAVRRISGIEFSLEDVFISLIEQRRHATVQ